MRDQSERRIATYLIVLLLFLKLDAARCDSSQRAYTHAGGTIISIATLL